VVAPFASDVRIGPVTETDVAEPTRELTDREREILTFERHWWRFGAAKDAAVRHRFGLGVADYYQVLNAVIDHAGALAHDPLLVRRLRRQRIARREQRSARRLGLVTDG
jgi:hypothetical protein